MQPIKDYEGLYWACPSGQIWASAKRKWGERYLKHWLIGRGYEMVMLYKDKTPTKFLVHRLIAQSFISNPNNLPEVNHKDGNRRNNRPENLEWVSSKQNKKHAWEAGLYSHTGNNHYRSKLSPTKVREIRNLYQEGTEIAIIAKKFDVFYGTIKAVVKGVTWKHIL